MMQVFARFEFFDTKLAEVLVERCDWFSLHRKVVGSNLAISWSLFFSVSAHKSTGAGVASKNDEAVSGCAMFETLDPI